MRRPRIKLGKNRFFAKELRKLFELYPFLHIPIILFALAGCYIAFNPRKEWESEKKKKSREHYGDFLVNLGDFIVCFALLVWEIIFLKDLF